MTNDNIIIFDTTLRDGEQAPGFAMSKEEKLEIALALEDMGVDVIEAGFPVSSQKQFEAVEEIAKTVKNSVVCGLSRATDLDLIECAHALEPAFKRGLGRIHTFISTSAVHMADKLRLPPNEVLLRIRYSISAARNYTDDIEWSAEDASRTDKDFLCRAVETAIKAGARTVNIPDTVGYMMPHEYGEIFKMLKERVPNIDQAVLSTHCHDDLGLAVANSIEGVRAGARQVECTINSMGERAGNAAMPSVVMSLHARKDIFNLSSRIDTTKLTSVSQMVSRITNSAVPLNTPIVGENAFRHSSGIHQHGMARNRETYEIIRPEEVGQKMSMVFTRHSGAAGLYNILSGQGIVLTNHYLEAAYDEAMKIADADEVKIVPVDTLVTIAKGIQEAALFVP